MGEEKEKPRHQPIAEGHATSVMKAMGAPKSPRHGFFTPIPPDQHRWQIAPKEPPLYRIHSWLVERTCSWAAGPEHGCAYAVDLEGKEMHFAHLVEDVFDGNAGVATRYWKEGEARGLWRKGTETEGVRKLYLCWAVRPAAELSEEATPEIVCTDNLPDYILKELKKLPKTRQLEFATKLKYRREVEHRRHAVMLAGLRLISDQENRILFREFGLEKRRIAPEETPNGNGNHRGTETRALAAAILPQIGLCVQTIETLYEIEEKTAYEEKNGAVLNETGGASLLPSEDQRKARESDAGSGSISVVVSRGPAKAKTPPHEEQKPPRPWHRFVSPEAVPKWESEAETQARDLLFDQISRMQLAYKHADFSQEALTLKKPTHELLVYRLLQIIGPEDALLFCVQVAAKFKGYDRNSLAKLPPRSPDDPNGPRSVALLLDWACDFAETRQKTRAARGGA